MPNNKAKLSISVSFITKSAVIAAVYAAITLMLAPLSFGTIQFRLSEALCVLPFLMPEAIPGLFIGCIIANLFTQNILILDVVFGSLASLFAAILTYQCRKFKHGFWFAPLPATIVNAVVIGTVIAYSSAVDKAAFWGLFGFNFITVGISEALVTFVFGLPLLYIIKKRFSNISQ